MILSYDQILVAIILTAAFIVYNSKETIAFRERTAAVRMESKKLLSRAMLTRRKRAARTALEFSLFLAVVYLILSGNIFWAVVVSNSMVPTFERGDMVLVQRIHVEPEKGDIVMFNRGDLNLPVTHRVLGVKGNLVYTGGDSSGPDPTPVRIDNIVGEVVTVFGKPVVLRGVGSYFILDAKELRDIGPYGQEYLFYKNLISLIREYALVILIVAITVYVYTILRELGV